MKNCLLLAAAAAAMGVGGCATAPMAPPIAGDMTPEAAGAYVQLAGASDMFEIQSSQLALSRAQDASVRQFAQTMIDHHTQTSQQLIAAARAAGLTPEPRLMPMQVQMMEQLEAASGAAFEQLYMDQQVQAHEMAVALHSNYAEAGDTTALRTVARAAVPIVTQHLQRARQLDR